MFMRLFVGRALGSRGEQTGPCARGTSDYGEVKPTTRKRALRTQAPAGGRRRADAHSQPSGCSAAPRAALHRLSTANATPATQTGSRQSCCDHGPRRHAGLCSRPPRTRRLSWRTGRSDLRPGTRKKGRKTPVLEYSLCRKNTLRLLPSGLTPHQQALLHPRCNVYRAFTRCQPLCWVPSSSFISRLPSSAL